MLNIYDDSITREWAATPYVGSRAEVESAIPTLVSPMAVMIR